MRLDTERRGEIADLGRPINNGHALGHRVDNGNRLPIRDGRGDADADGNTSRRGPPIHPGTGIDPDGRPEGGLGRRVSRHLRHN